MSADLVETQTPIIIIGMHRSGTSMIARMLEALGLFLGWRKEDNHEALTFLRKNEWIMRQSGAAWDNPKPIEYLLANRDMRRLNEKYLQLSLGSYRSLSFLGPRMFARYRSLARLDTPWGWKDPRSTFTLPIWRQVFPRAKIIHVCRHGVDVAHSLQVRHHKMLVDGAERFRRRKLLHSFIGKRSGFTTGARCSTLHGGFTLWKEYIREAQKHVATLGDRSTEVRYETFLAEPERFLALLTNFCGLNPSERDLREVAAWADSGRAYAFRSKPELREFAGCVQDNLEQSGYSN